MLNINSKIIFLPGFLILIAITNIILTHFQTALAFSLPGPLDKIFGGLFQKPSNSINNQKESTSVQQIHQNLGNKSNTNSNATTALLLASISLSSVTNLTIPTECHIVNGSLPDTKCTPGSTNPSVNQINIKNTICVPGFSKTIRPPVSYTNPLKINLMHSYGFTDSRSNYELDHLIPLSIGGNPKSVTNLWPEPGYGQYNFHIKDRFENYLYRSVCNGKISLDDAQKEIATNWIESWKKEGQP